MGLFSTLKRVLIGGKKDPNDPGAFHQITLLAFFAWVGLGSDGLSSSCYGPPEVFLALGNNIQLSLLIGLATVVTIVIISSSYSQIIELFPTGGGGYMVASKLLSPHTAMVSGSALMIDYVLTITVSISSGADALFSFLPPTLHQYKLPFALFIVAVLTILNMRGAKESVMPLVPIFIIFVISHIFIIIYAVVTHLYNLDAVVTGTTTTLHHSFNTIGTFGTLFILVHAYSMGAGTYTGIEAVSNGLPILREPKLKTARKTMFYMAASLSFTAFGLMLAYLLYNLKFSPGKTLNAILFEQATIGWNPSFAGVFIIVTLLSEAAILFVAAQTGFLGGPAVLANMAQDRWVPSSFASLSDRLVTQKGVLLMGISSFVLLAATKGSVTFLLVLYSINVFITFTLSQLGMVKHWWQERKTIAKWKRKISVNGIGLILTTFILVSVTIVKFNEGGWITIIITGSLITVCMIIKNDYNKTGKMLRNLDQQLTEMFESQMQILPHSDIKPKYDPTSRTAILLVNGFSGVGVHSLMSIFRLFGNAIKNFVFIEIGVIDSTVFKGTIELEKLKDKIKNDTDKYIDFMHHHGYFAESYTSLGLDVEKEIMKILHEIKGKYHMPIFFGGQIVFPRDTMLTRMLHNYTVFSIQRQLYIEGVEFIILPIKMRDYWQDSAGADLSKSSEEFKDKTKVNAKLN